MKGKRSEQQVMCFVRLHFRSALNVSLETNRRVSGEHDADKVGCLAIARNDKMTNHRPPARPQFEGVAKEMLEIKHGR